MKPIEVGDTAPEFTAIAADGRPISLADFRGKQPVVLFFYPRDHSPVCTAEVCSFRDAYEEFTSLGAAVIGVSGDSDQSHRAFTEKQRLPYPLIADGDGRLRKLFGVPNTLLVLPGRVTYVIDREGIVRLKFNSQLKGAQHAAEALIAVQNMDAKK